MPFKMHKISFFTEKNVCLPYLKFSDLLPKTHIFCLAWAGHWASFLCNRYIILRLIMSHRCNNLAESLKWRYSLQQTKIFGVSWVPEKIKTWNFMWTVCWMKYQVMKKKLKILPSVNFVGALWAKYWLNDAIRYDRWIHRSYHILIRSNIILKNKIEIIFLCVMHQFKHICFGCSNKLPRWDGSF